VSYIPLIEDQAAAHQIRFRLQPNGLLLLTCNCGAWLDTRATWTAREAHAAWIAHASQQREETA
jgi:hypothetical protein